MYNVGDLCLHARGHKLTARVLIRLSVVWRLESGGGHSLIAVLRRDGLVARDLINCKV